MPEYRCCVSLDATTPLPGYDLTLVPGQNLFTGATHFRKAFGSPTTLEEDLLNVASAIFCADLGCLRGERENITRVIDLSIPVVNHAAFQSIRKQLCHALFILSHDAWRIEFVRSKGTPESQQDPAAEEGTVLLFSGGLDSLAAAVQLGNRGTRTHLVSHVTSNQSVKSAQSDLFASLNLAYPSVFSHTTIRASGRKKGDLPFPADTDRESSQRTRSFLFLAIAALVARRCGIHEVVWIAENGQLAIHLPLTAGRISAFSTHTAHPEFVQAAEELFSSLLDFQLKVENPFLYDTKAEVVQQACQQHPDLVERSISCWKASRVAGAKNHCGICIPCLIRRIANEINGLFLDEYARDLFAVTIAALDVDDDGKRNLVELAEFVAVFEQLQTDAELFEEYPELQNGTFDSEKAIAVYRRFAVEARTVFDRYPSITECLQ